MHMTSEANTCAATEEMRRTQPTEEVNNMCLRAVGDIETKVVVFYLILDVF